MKVLSLRFLMIMTVQIGLGLFTTLLAPGFALAQTPDLVMAYAVDEGTGTALADTSGNGWNGTLTNGPVWVAGKYGSSLSLDGVNDYVSIGDVDIPGNALTMSLWIKQDAPQSGWGSVVMKRLTYGFEVNGTTLHFGIGNGSSWSGTMNTPLSTGVWQHIAATFNGSMISLFKNGVQVGSVPATLTNSNIALLLGAWTSSSEFFKGQIDNIRLYNRVLSLAEIQTDMNTPVGTTVAGSSCDLTQNGSVDPDDVYLSVDMALGLTPCTADIVGPGICNAIVTQRIVNAFLGQPCVTGTTGQPRSVLLTWTASPSGNVAGHNIYRATTSGGQPTKINTSLVVPTGFTDTTVQEGQTYYYVVTAVDTGNAESGYSNQAVAVVPSS